MEHAENESELKPPDENSQGASSNLKERTKSFAMRVIRLYCALPQTVLAQTLGKQVLRSATSVGAHYREGMRARSNAEFNSKIEGGLQELEETTYWFELLIESKVITAHKLGALQKEADELMAMLVKSVKTAKARK